MAKIPETLPAIWNEQPLADLLGVTQPLIAGDIKNSHLGKIYNSLPAIWNEQQEIADLLEVTQKTISEDIHNSHLGKMYNSLPPIWNEQLLADTAKRRTYFMGLLYRETKKERTDTLIQNAPMANNLPTGSTAEAIGEQFGVSHQTVKNAEKFADAVDTIARAELALEMEEAIARKAKENQAHGQTAPGVTLLSTLTEAIDRGDNNPPSGWQVVTPKEDPDHPVQRIKPIDTRAEVAKIAEVSQGTFWKAKIAFLSENDLHRLRTVDYLDVVKVFLPGEEEGA